MRFEVSIFKQVKLKKVCEEIHSSLQGARRTRDRYRRDEQRRPRVGGSFFYHFQAKGVRAVFWRMFREFGSNLRQISSKFQHISELFFEMHLLGICLLATICNFHFIH